MAATHRTGGHEPPNPTVSGSGVVPAPAARPPVEPSAPAAPGPLAWIRRYPLAAYFILAFAGIWAFMLPVLLARNGFGLLPVTLPADLFGGLGTVAAHVLSTLLITAAVEGRPGLLQLLRRYLRWRVDARWYLVVCVPTAIWLVAAVAAGATSPAALARQWSLLLPAYLQGVLTVLVVGQLWEEVGWRGFALPRLQRRVGPLAASLLLGVAQGLWHLPFFFIAEGVSQEKVAWSISTFAAVVLSSTLGSAVFGVILTWLYNGTGGSLFVVILFHLSLTAGYRLVFTLTSDPAVVARIKVIELVSYLVLALLLIAVTRGRLAYMGTAASQPTEARTADSGLAGA